MSRYYHFKPPKPEDYNTEEEYEKALEEWESAEDEYAEDFLEMVRMERFNN